MNTAYNTKSTKTMKAVAASLVMGECCEPDCKMTIMVEKDDLTSGRQNHCTACLMKRKLHGVRK